MAKKPQLVIVSGPNGVGKSTIAYQYAHEHSIDYLGADDIAAELDGNEIKAGKVFFKRLDDYYKRNKSVIIESTLSGTGLLKRIEKFRKNGYTITIVFVFLESVTLCKRRIRIRVKKGGHDIPAADIERRFSRSINNFWKKYRLIADEWQILYNSGARPVEVAFNEKNCYVIQDEDFYKKFQGLLK